MREDPRQHEDRGPHSPMDAGQDGSLTDLLDRCGHYFAHRIGASRRGQGNVVTFLAQHPDVTQKELAEALGVIPASLSEVLMKLERKGLVERKKDEHDRRLVRVRLTEEGQKRLEHPDTTLSEPFQALSQEEQETLKQLLSKLLADWEKRCVTERRRPGGRPHHEHPRHDREHPGRGSDHGDKHGSGPEGGRRGHGRHGQEV